MRNILLLLLLALLATSSVAAWSTQAEYDGLFSSLASQATVVQSIPSSPSPGAPVAAWIPWYASSSSCTLSDLHQGSSCASGETIDFTHNCMVSDEFSQYAILASVSSSQERIDTVLTTLPLVQSTSGILPSWRSYRSGDSVEACRSGINGNCDTASDADARLAIAFFQASTNPSFSGTSAYFSTAHALVEDMIVYEINNLCTDSSLGFGDICWWMAAGKGAASGGLGSADYGYTGYYADGIIAMLMACDQTGNTTYCAIAGNLTLNYLQAAYPPGTSLSTFRTPPGRSFRWTQLDSVPVAQCTNTCSPVEWDSADAIRAFSMCQANSYAHTIGQTLPGMNAYCALWLDRHLTDVTRTPLQYAPDGSSTRTAQSGYLAQGLLALLHTWSESPDRQAALDLSLNHYSSTTQSFDSAACMGVYFPALPLRAFGQQLWLDSLSTPPPTPIAPDITFVENVPVDVPAADVQQPTIEESPAAPDAPLLQTLFDSQQQQLGQEGQQELTGYGGYVATYTVDDLPLIVEDGVGTTLAAVVENSDLLMMFIALLGAALIIQKFQSLR